MSHPRLDPSHNFSAVQIKWLRLGEDAQERRNAGPRRSTTRLQPDGVLLRNTNRSFSRLIALLDGPDRSRLRAAGERTRCRRTYSDSRTGRRSPTRRWWSAAWLHGGGL